MSRPKSAPSANTSGSNESPSEDATKILEIVKDAKGAGAPGCAVGVFRNGKVEFVFSGSADIAARRPPNADTLYYSGSIAKQFTALAVIQLVVKRQINLDSDIREFLPEMPLRHPPITVAMLLHHTSGLPNSAKLLPLAGYQRVSDATWSEVLPMLLRYSNSAFPPGATFEYSNGGYLLLSEIVARQTGEPFASYVKANILDPIGMTRSSVLNGTLSVDANLARGYMPTENTFALSEDMPNFGGAGAMMLTLNDLFKYHHDIIVGHRVWTSEVSKLMTEPGKYADGSPIIVPVPGHIFGYASGLMLGPQWALHGGNFAGFQALFAWLPGTQYALAILCNRGDVKPLELAARIWNAIEPDLPSIDAPRFTLAGHAGRFVSDAIPAIYEIALAGDDLNVTIKPPGDLPPLKQTFTRSGDGVYSRGPIILTFDPDRRGMRISADTVSERFRRAQ